MRFAVLSTLFACTVAAQKQQVTKARVILFAATPGQMPGKVVGVVDFYQEAAGVRLNGTINGLAAGQHGFHGDLSDGCLAAGGHYNPLGHDHGAPTVTDRHNGDLGNIVSPASGPTQIQLRDAILTLNGQYSVLGRALVVHEKADDLGLGGTNASKTTGDAGARVACGVIGIA